MIRGIARYAKLRSPPWQIRWCTHYFPDLASMENMQGYVYFALDEADRVELFKLTVPGVNLSLRNMPVPHSSVVPDDRAIGQMAAKHLKEALYRRFAFVGAQAISYCHTRLEGFLETISPHTCEVFWSPHQEKREVVNQQLQDFLAKLEPPVAIFAPNDYLARRICEMALAIDRRVPEDFAVLGVDAESMIALSSPVELSSIDLDSYNIGHRAAQELDRLISNPDEEPQTISLPPNRVVIGKSTAHLATEDEMVAKAVQLINLHACSGVTVEDLVSKLNVSRRSLERKFRLATNRSVHEQITKVRLNRAMELLVDNRYNISEIAEMTCFADMFYFSRCFKKATGMSPREYRIKK